MLLDADVDVLLVLVVVLEVVGGLLSPSLVPKVPSNCLVHSLAVTSTTKPIGAASRIKGSRALVPRIYQDLWVLKDSGRRESGVNHELRLFWKC